MFSIYPRPLLSWLKSMGRGKKHGSKQATVLRQNRKLLPVLAGCFRFTVRSLAPLQLKDPKDACGPVQRRPFVA